MSVHKDELTVALRALQIRRMADTLVERSENEEVDYEWLRPRLQALIEGVEWTATDKVTPKKRDLAQERYEEVIQFWNNLTKPEPILPAMIEDWKPFISLPREHGRVLSNRKIREMRKDGWELFYLPGKPFLMFETLDHFVCDDMWSKMYSSYPKLSEGPGYWFWAQTSPTASRQSVSSSSLMNLLEYLVAMKMCAEQGLPRWDRGSTTVVKVTEDHFRHIGFSSLNEKFEYYNRVFNLHIEGDSGWREVRRLVP